LADVFLRRAAARRLQPWVVRAGTAHRGQSRRVHNQTAMRLLRASAQRSCEGTRHSPCGHSTDRTCDRLLCRAGARITCAPVMKSISGPRPPKVSVMIPCYDLGAYLDEAVASVLAQTYQDF